jgi:hypothetical protein
VLGRLTLAVAFASLLLASPASAVPYDELSACFIELDRDVELTGPSTVAPGRTFVAELNVTRPGIFAQVDDGEWSPLEGVTATNTQELALEVTPGDGPSSELTLRWPYRDSDFPTENLCRMERWLSVRVAPRDIAYDLRLGINGDVTLAGGVHSINQCSAYSPRKLQLTVESQGRRARVDYSDQCFPLADRTRARRKHHGWSLSAGYWGPKLSVSPTSGPASQRFRITLRVGTKVRRWTETAYRERTPAAPPRRYWEGSDEYWNYCVRGGRDIRQQDGRKYCDRPGRAARSEVLWG